MVTVSQYLIPSEQFWGSLPSEYVDATVSSRLKSHVSFDDMVATCADADDLKVVESHGATLVGLRDDEPVLPGGWMPLEDFISEYSDRWAIIPEEGCTVEYVDDDWCNGRAVLLPRLKELEPGREHDPKGLLFAIVNALGLARVDLNMREHTVTYY